MLHVALIALTILRHLQMRGESRTHHQPLDIANTLTAAGGPKAGPVMKTMYHDGTFSGPHL